MKYCISSLVFKMNFVLVHFLFISLLVQVNMGTIFHTFGKFLFPQSSTQEQGPGDHYGYAGQGSLSSHLNKYYGYDCSTALSLLATIGYLIYLSIILPQTVRDVGHLFGSRPVASTTTASSIVPYRKKRSLEKMDENIFQIPFECWEREICSINRKISQKFSPEMSPLMELYKTILGPGTFSWTICANFKDADKLCKPFERFISIFLSKVFEKIEKI